MLTAPTLRGRTELDWVAPASGLSTTCEILTSAERGDASTARVAFDRAHEPIHEVAGRASAAGHREVAARLLEAKNAAETATGPTATEAEQLVTATRHALRALGDPTEPCS